MYEWDLGIFYQGLDDPKYLEDVKKIDNLIVNINQTSEQLDGDVLANLQKIVDIFLETDLLMSNVFNYLELSASVDSTNANIRSQIGALSVKFANCARATSKMEKYIANTHDLEKIIESDAKLLTYKAFLLNIKEENKYALSDEIEEVIAKLSTNSTANWSNLQGYLTSIVEVEYEGKKITLPQVRNMAYDENPQVRKKAYDAELASYAKIKDATAFALNSLKGHVNTICELRKFESPLDQALKRSRMSKETLDALISAIEDYLPKFHTYLQHKGILLGHQNGLPWYDLFAPMGKSNNSKYTIEDSKTYLLEQFSSFSSDMCKMIETAYDQKWIDFLPRGGKAGGAFCANLQIKKQSRILTNFDGSLSDCITLAHELGHAYHGMQIEDLPILNPGYTMPLAETASTFNEVIVMNNAIKNAKSTEEKIMLIESTLQDLTQIICDIYSRYLFESNVFKKRQDSFMYADELEKMMLDAQIKAYGKGLDNTCLHPYMWVNKGHYYSDSLSFYNFPYAFGGLFARGLYAIYKEQPNGFVEKYNNLLKATCTKSVEEVAIMADIDLTKKAFWSKSLKNACTLIDEFIELTK